MTIIWPRAGKLNVLEYIGFWQPKKLDKPDLSWCNLDLFTSLDPIQRQFHQKLKPQPESNMSENEWAQHHCQFWSPCLPLSSSTPRRCPQFPCTSAPAGRSGCSRCGHTWDENYYGQQVKEYIDKLEVCLLIQDTWACLKQYLSKKVYRHVWCLLVKTAAGKELPIRRERHTVHWFLVPVHEQQLQ